uniref:hypothetical protein n=1 Tax=Sphingomonas sp. TaxID=28214 RepID=UPI00325FA66F
VNINQTCNAVWNGSAVNFYKSGGGCNNTGEIAGVFLHEWGHGLDQNDGGGFDNPSEAYADVTSIMGPVTKRAVCVRRIEDLERILRAAFRVARGPRPGPVLVDIPNDILKAKCAKMDHFAHSSRTR